MKKIFKNKSIRYTLIITVIAGLGLSGHSCNKRSDTEQAKSETIQELSDFSTIESLEAENRKSDINNDAGTDACIWQLEEFHPKRWIAF